MRNYSKTIGALAAASTLVAGFAMAGSEGSTSVAAQTGLQGELHAGVSSLYIWRGTQIGDGRLVEAGLDLKGEVAGLNLSGGAWYGSLTGDRARQSGWNTYDELDLYAQVSKDLGFATVSVGHISYIYPNQKGRNDNVDEAYVGLSREIFPGITASLTDYYGYDARYFDGTQENYLQFGLAKTVKFTDCLSLDLGSSLGYVATEGTLNDVGVTATLNYQFAKNARLSPYIGETVGLADKNRQYIGYEKTSQFYGGVKLAVSF
jgi:hypothetical protein